jgi:hypothetical protein
MVGSISQAGYHRHALWILLHFTSRSPINRQVAFEPQFLTVQIQEMFKTEHIRNRVRSKTRADGYQRVDGAARSHPRNAVNSQIAELFRENAPKPLVSNGTQLYLT